MLIQFLSNLYQDSMKLSLKTKNSINSRIKKVRLIVAKNNGYQIAELKDELLEIIQEIEEESHRCFTSQDE